MSGSVALEALYETLGLANAPFLVDVRSDYDVTATPRLIPGAVRVKPSGLGEWARTLPRTQRIVVYCSDGDAQSSASAKFLATLGFPAMPIEGGIQAWLRAGYATTRIRTAVDSERPSRWVTRERPKIDRLACPWLVRRFIDPEAAFFYVPAHRVREAARDLEAEPYDIADVTFSHRGPECSFDAFLREFDLHDSSLEKMAHIVRAADTGELAQSREAPGLLAISLGLSHNIQDDMVLLEHAMQVYDALYTWCKTTHKETHSWPKKFAT